MPPPLPDRRLARLRDRLSDPVDIASLAVFRVLFGAILFVEVIRYPLLGWIDTYYVEPEIHLGYYGFSWLPALPEAGWCALFGALGVAALGVAAGWLYRASCTVFWLGFSYSFLIEQSRYLNHLYLVCLLAFLMIFVPAHRAYSVDAWRKPTIRADTTPRWALSLLRFQLGVVYIYAGIAKLDGDWLSGQPLYIWLNGRADDPLVGGAWLTWPETALVFSWGGMLLDLLVVPALLWRPTRAAAFIAASGFHLMNARLWGIGIFPWMALAATTLFLDPSWPRRILPRRPPIAQSPRYRLPRLGLAALACWALFQLAFPLRHRLYPGVTAWTEAGHKFSWRMKLRTKRARIRVYAVDPATGVRRRVILRDHLTARQREKVVGRPEMLLQLAHHLRDTLPTEGDAPAEIYMDLQISLNGRPPQPLIDPDVDLGAQPWDWRPAPWVLPLETPLPPLRETWTPEGPG